MPRRLILSTALLALSLALTGCGRKGVNTVTVRDGAVNSVVLDGGLDDIASVTEVNQFNRGDTLYVQVAVTNDTGRDASFLTRWEWFEGDFRVPALENDRVRTIKARETMTLDGVAPNASVDGWTLKLSRAN